MAQARIFTCQPGPWQPLAHGFCVLQSHQANASTTSMPSCATAKWSTLASPSTSAPLFEFMSATQRQSAVVSVDSSAPTSSFKEPVRPFPGVVLFVQSGALVDLALSSLPATLRVTLPKQLARQTLHPAVEAPRREKGGGLVLTAKPARVYLRTLPPPAVEF